MVSVRPGGMFTARAERPENVTDGTADMNANRNSDESVVPATSANNDAAEASAESIEERDSAKRNAQQPALSRTPCRTHGKSRGLHGVREAPNDFAFDSRQEPYEVILHVRICAGGRRQRRSLPRYCPRDRGCRLDWVAGVTKIRPKMVLYMLNMLHMWSLINDMQPSEKAVGYVLARTYVQASI